jgi:hypothetical protein
LADALEFIIAGSMPTQVDIDSNGLAAIINRFRILGRPKIKHMRN